MKKLLSGKLNASSTYDYTQDLIDVKDICNGFVFLGDGSIVKILEILPINYDEKSDAAKDAIATNFGLIFKKFPKNGQIKIMDAKTNLDSFIKKMEEFVVKETEPKVIEHIIDYTKNVRELQKEKTAKKRFFYIFSYEGNANGKISSDFEEILNDMWNQMHIIANSFASCGNVVLNADDDNLYEAEILYSFFNPGTYDDEGIQQRLSAVKTAATSLSNLGIKKNPLTVDYLAPRGLRFGKYDYMVVDGKYQTYLALRDTSYPTECVAGWINRLLSEPEVDVDIHIHRDFKETSVALLDRYTVIKKGIALNREGDTAKQQELMSEAYNSEFMLKSLKDNDEDLYQVTIIVTLRANTHKELMNKKATYLKNMRLISFYYDDCFLLTQDYYKMTMPLNYKLPSITKSNSRNMVNSSLASLYCFTTYEMFTSDGWIMGTLAKNETLFSFNTFDRRIFSNPMIFIAGQIGSGKTYTQLMLATRMRMTGVRTMFVLPLKGHEYRDAVESVGGAFISLFPGGKACLNIMDIRPEAMVQDDGLDDEVRELLARSLSLRAKKITSIITWVTLLIGQEIPYDAEGELNVAIGRVYDRYGITDDNDSIWFDKAKRIRKKMPILSDLMDEIKDNPKLEKVVSMLRTWTEGSCSNMNGQTNVDLNAKTIAFDINENAIGKRFLPAFMYLAFDVCYGIAKQDLSEYCAIFLDEVWKLLTLPTCAEQVFECIKIVRAYRCSVASATQDIADCSGNKYGRAILTESATKIFLKSSLDEVKLLAQSVNLSDENMFEIQGMKRGQGFISFNTERVKVNFKSSDWEEELYTPAADDKARIRQRRMLKQGL